jgi:DNA polymerase-3 subunit epsilon
MYQYTSLPHLFESGSVFTAFDTETTGLYPSTERIIEIGAVKFDKDGVIATYGTLINPNKCIPSQASKVNGISDDIVRDCPAIETVIPEFISFISGTKLVAHNAGFDISFLESELQRCGMSGIKSPAVPAVDTLRFAKKAYPGLTKYNLQYLAEYFNIGVKNAHRAEDDARVCMEIFRVCINKVPKKKTIL